jgi:ribosome recycling factor
MPIDEILLEAEDNMGKTEEHLVHEFTGVRTGKASPALVENVVVEVYGSQMRLRELAGITTPESRSLLIQPWDISTTGAIEKGIQKANLGLNPASDGKIIRIALPELSTERRQELTKVVRRMAEDGRVSVRHARRDALEQLKKDAKTENIPEDDVSHTEKEIQKLTDKFVSQIDKTLELKEKEIMKV